MGNAFLEGGGRLLAWGSEYVRAISLPMLAVVLVLAIAYMRSDACLETGKSCLHESAEAKGAKKEKAGESDSFSKRFLRAKRESKSRRTQLLPFISKKRKEIAEMISAGDAGSL